MPITLRNKSCWAIGKNLKHFESGLQLENGLLLSKNKTRTKKGVINVIGNIANSLFGVLDMQYAMPNTIELVKQHESHLDQLLKNQTSVIDSTINIFAEKEVAIKTKFDTLVEQIIHQNISAHLHAERQSDYQSQFFEIFTSLTIQLLTS